MLNYTVQWHKVHLYHYATVIRIFFTLQLYTHQYICQSHLNKPVGWGGGGGEEEEEEQDKKEEEGKPPQNENFFLSFLTGELIASLISGHLQELLPCAGPWAKSLLLGKYNLSSLGINRLKTSFLGRE